MFVVGALAIVIQGKTNNFLMCISVYGEYTHVHLWDILVATVLFCGSPDLPNGHTQNLLGRYQGDAHEGKLFI